MHYYFIDFFCGAGGSSLGFSQAGYTILAGLDFESAVAETYKQIENSDATRPQFLHRNLFFRNEEHPTGQGDVVIKDIKQLLTGRNFNPKEDFLVFGISAPCQPFSKLSGKQVSDERALKRERDSNLLLVCLEYIKQFKPDAVFIENVAGIGSSTTDKVPVLTLFKNDVERAKYIFASSPVNANDFGVPQERRREIGVAVRVGRTAALSIPTRDPEASPMTVKQAIGHLPALAPGERSVVPNHIARNLTTINLLRLKSLKPGENNLGLRSTRHGDLSLPCHQRLEEKSGKQSYADTYTRMHPDQYAPTITTRCNSISNGRFGHYDIRQIRGITPREAAALQTFPDDFIFYPVNETDSAAKQIGNAVPPRMARFFADFVKNVMLGINLLEIPIRNRRRSVKVALQSKHIPAKSSTAQLLHAQPEAPS